MKLIEKHIISRNHKYFDEADKICFQSKNIYNSCLYIIKKTYEETGSYPKSLYREISSTDCWKQSPIGTKITNQTRLLVEQTYRGYFAAYKDWTKRPNKYLGMPKPPPYKHSLDGRVVATYTNESISKKEFLKTGRILLSKTNIYIKTKITDFKSIKQVKIVPRGNHYIVFVIYEIPDVEQVEGGYASIDLGLNNLATMTFLDGSKPLIFNGKPLKSMNQYYNKVKADLQSKLPNNRKTSNKIGRLTCKRNEKIDSFLHLTSKLIVKNLVSNQISCLVIGKNDGWKQDINIGRKNNQNFCNIPYKRFIDMITYKALLCGIKTISHEESYTSKCSFLDLEEVKKHETYKGKRVKRGLFKASDGRTINADVNGSYNILRKVIPEAFTPEGIEGFAVIPLRMTPSFS